MSFSLADRSIVVTGAAGGLGTTVCRVLLQAGARVTAGVYSMSLGAELRDSLGDLKQSLRVVAVDATDAHSVESLYLAAHDFSGPNSGSVLLVGGYAGGTKLGATPDSELDRMLDLNVRSVWTCSREALRRMASGGGGRLVTVSSAGAVRGTAGHAAYCATKAAVQRLTESAAEDYKDRDITANSVLPGMIATPANLAAMPDADHTRWVTPEQIAHTVQFLLSDEASGVNGAAIRITGRG